MWILPKQLHTSAFVPDTVALISDLSEQSQACELSLTARSTHLPAQTWLRKLKKDSWMRLLYGRMLKPSQANAFTEKWTSFLEDIRANRSAQQASDLEKTTLDTFGHTLGNQSKRCDPQLAFSKMFTDISTLGSVMSCKIWKALVTAQCGEYSRRLKLAHAMNGSGYSSLPTPCANEDSFRLNGSSQQSKTLEAKARRGELMTAGNAPGATEMFLTAAHATTERFNVPSAKSGHIHFTMNTVTDANSVGDPLQAGQTIKAGPLNPAFVEVMMGVPIGWTDYVCSATELSQPPQSLPLGH